MKKKKHEKRNNKEMKYHKTQKYFPRFKNPSELIFLLSFLRATSQKMNDTSEALHDQQGPLLWLLLLIL